MTSVSIDQTALPHIRELHFAGARCDLRTSSYEFAGLLESISNSTEEVGPPRFEMRIVVDDKCHEAAGPPHFRGLHHVVTASFGNSNLFVFDVLRRTLTATISRTVARDSRFWQQKLVPITLGVLGAAIGVVPVHCACLESQGDGLLIAGISGAGKSTLSAVLSQNGFNYISDDWTYISECEERLVAYGTSAPVKLLPDALTYFRGLEAHRVQRSMNGEMAYEIDIAELAGVRAEQGCEPRWLIFLERTTTPGGQFVSVSSAEARSYLDSSVERLPAQLMQATAMRQRIISRVSELPRWRFRYGGAPQFATGLIREFVAEQRQRG